MVTDNVNVSMDASATNGDEVIEEINVAKHFKMYKLGTAEDNLSIDEIRQEHRDWLKNRLKNENRKKGEKFTEKFTNNRIARRCGSEEEDVGECTSKLLEIGTRMDKKFVKRSNKLSEVDLWKWHLNRRLEALTKPGRGKKVSELQLEQLNECDDGEIPLENLSWLQRRTEFHRGDECDISLEDALEKAKAERFVYVRRIVQRLQDSIQWWMWDDEGNFNDTSKDVFVDCNTPGEELATGKMDVMSCAFEIMAEDFDAAKKRALFITQQDKIDEIKEVLMTKLLVRDFSTDSDEELWKLVSSSEMKAQLQPWHNEMELVNIFTEDRRDSIFKDTDKINADDLKEIAQQLHERAYDCLEKQIKETMRFRAAGKEPKRWGRCADIIDGRVPLVVNAENEERGYRSIQDAVDTVLAHADGDDILTDDELNAFEYLKHEGHYNNHINEAFEDLHEYLIEAQKPKAEKRLDSFIEDLTTRFEDTTTRFDKFFEFRAKYEDYLSDDELAKFDEFQTTYAKAAVNSLSRKGVPKICQQVEEITQEYAFWDDDDYVLTKIGFWWRRFLSDAEVVSQYEDIVKECSNYLN